MDGVTFNTVFFHNQKRQVGQACISNDYCQSTNCENSICLEQSIDCPSTEVSNSNYAEVGSLTGAHNDTPISVICDNGFSGGGEWSCDDTGTWEGETCGPDGLEYIGCFTDGIIRAMNGGYVTLPLWETLSEEELAESCNIECYNFDYFLNKYLYLFE